MLKNKKYVGVFCVKENVARKTIERSFKQPFLENMNKHFESFSMKHSYVIPHTFTY